ncbi:type IX secretion system membrane protein PorP/SprF [Paraflavitalea soli]|uniref:Type IX secretion system membrane protein PorP/SprF n=1 Tax=Paraflavitalea soli TaxID=2315862 RepID=A0A3B7MSR7_9BACT|nr:PorP/SprF family type IX secretion system membrane protein [Paraflavitalea soli]AXY77552.1 type IX secretion system membrane protein PorP/SprF [Paraflavitalea soli]
MKNVLNWRRYSFTGILLCALTLTHAQDIHFSQFFEAPLLRNPSLAGIYSGDVRIQGVYRDQWNSFTNAYRTGSLNAEYKMPVGKGDDFMTIGGQVLFDKAGTVGLTTTSLLPALNYHKSLSNEKAMYLSLGFMGGMIRKSIDASKMTTDNQYGPGGYDPTAPTGEILTTPNFNTWDASVGMSFNTTFGEDKANSYFLGAAYHHLNRPKNSFYRNASIELKPKYVFSGGITFGVDEYSYFIVQADHSIQGSFTETVGGALYSYKLGDDPVNPLYTIHAGAFLRWKDALIPVIKLDRYPLSVALSYDVNVSQLKTASQGRGGVEISLSWISYLDRDNSSRDKVLCPRF